jgi:hypothetical protein
MECSKEWVLLALRYHNPKDTPSFCLQSMGGSTAALAKLHDDRCVTWQMDGCQTNSRWQNLHTLTWTGESSNRSHACCLQHAPAVPGLSTHQSTLVWSQSGLGKVLWTATSCSTSTATGWSSLNSSRPSSSELYDGNAAPEAP